MNKKRFTKKQIEEFSKNKNIKKCSEKRITYGSNFKVKAVKQYCEECLLPKDIFIQAKFDLEVIGEDTPRYCLMEWKKIYQNKGINALKTENRGRAKKIRDKSDKDKIERLEAENAYLKEEKKLLIKLRAERGY